MSLTPNTDQAPELDAQWEEDALVSGHALIAEAIIKGSRLITAAILSTNPGGDRVMQSMLRFVTNLKFPERDKKE